MNEVIEQVYKDAAQTGIVADDTPLRKGGMGARSYAEAIGFYLGMNVGRQANRLSALCFWHPGGEKVEPFFSRQAFTMNWNFTEANPFSDSSGNFLGQLEYLTRVLENLPAHDQGYVLQQDAVKAEYTTKLMFSTDPPYYDNVPYADLSDFFYIWLRRSLYPIYPDILGTMLVPKDAELVADHQRLGGRDAANAYFEDGMRQVFAKIHDATLGYPVTVYYAFRQADTDDNGDEGQVISSSGWETMLEGLTQAGFMIRGTWPMRTEQATNIKKYRNALASSIVLVCRPRPDNAPTTSRREFVNALRRELPPALRDMQSGNIAPVDLAQASIGPGMAVYSRYRLVLEANGEALSVRTALQLINQELDTFLAETEGDVDADTRFCINWFEQFGFREAEFGVADVLARAKNTSVAGLADAGVLVASAGKVRLLPWQEVDPGWTPQGDKRVTVWECVHHLIERINTHGESGAAALLLRMNSELAAEAKMLAYRLYQICDRKGWAEYALEYNALVLSWPRLQELANELKQNQPPEQLGMF